MSRGELDYQPRHSAVFYTPPTRLRPVQALVAMIGALIGAVVGGIIYAKTLPHLENMILRAISTGVAAGAIGLLSTAAASIGKVRSAFFACFEGAIISTVAIYAMWIVWTHDALAHFGYVSSYGMLIRYPRILLRVIMDLNDAGTWTYNGMVARGFGLYVFWAAEAGLILLCGVLFPIKAVVSSDEIECRECFAVCRLIRPILRFTIWVQDELIAAVQNHDFTRLLAFQAPQVDHEPQLSLRLVSCSKCRLTNVITVNRITWSVISTGTRMEVCRVLNRLMVPPKQAEALQSLMPEIVSRQQAPPETEVEESTDEDENPELESDTTESFEE